MDPAVLVYFGIRMWPFDTRTSWLGLRSSDRVP